MIGASPGLLGGVQEMTICWLPGVPVTLVGAPGTTLTVTNVAVTLCACVIDTVQVAAAPEHAPPQLLNNVPTGALAVNVTDVPWL